MFETGIFALSKSVRKTTWLSVVFQSYFWHSKFDVLCPSNIETVVTYIFRGCVETAVWCFSRV